MHVLFEATVWVYFIAYTNSSYAFLGGRKAFNRNLNSNWIVNWALLNRRGILVRRTDQNLIDTFIFNADHLFRNTYLIGQVYFQYNGIKVKISFHF